MSAAKAKRTFFLTGYPGFIGKRLAAGLAARHPDAKLYLLVQPKFVKDAKKYLRSLAAEGVSVEIVAGDVADMHLGLSSAEYNQLCDEVTEVFHLAAISYLGVAPSTARKVNVEGTRNVLELAHDAKHLRRFHHFSTAYVSGDRVGVIAEDELDLGQQFRNAYEETKFHAEKLVRRAGERGLEVTRRPARSIASTARTTWASCWSRVRSTCRCRCREMASRRSTSCPSTTWWMRCSPWPR
jgi:thioester reductase-like protein